MGQFNWTPPKDAVPVEDNSTWKPPADAVPVVPKKAGGAGSPLSSPVSESTAPSLILGGNQGQSSPAHDNQFIGVTDNSLRQRLQRQNINPVTEQMKRAADVYKSQLTPEERQSFDNAVAQRPEDAMRQSTAEEIANDKKWDTPMGKLAKGVAYMGDKAGKGGLQIVKGGAWLINHLNSGFQDTQTIPDEPFNKAADAIDKFTGITKTDESRIENDRTMSSGLMRLGGMLGEFAPAIAGGEVSQAPKTMFALQGFGQGKESIDKADPDHKVNPVVRDTYVLATGLVNAALMGDAAETNFAKMPSALRSKITSAIAMDAIKDIGEKPLTSELLHSTVNNLSKDFADNFYKLGTDYVQKVAKTGLDLSGLAAANGVLKYGVNKESGTEVFSNPAGEAAEGVSNAMLTQAPILGAVGSVGDLSKLTPYSGFKNEVLTDVISDPSKAGEVKSDIEQHGHESGWTQGEIDATNAHVDAIADAAKKLPNTIKPEKRADAVELVISRDGLKQQLVDEQTKRANMDEAISEQPTQHEQYLTDKIEQANDKLRGLVSGKKATYSKGTQDDEGLYFKTVDGVKEEIPQSRYDLEALERDGGKEQVAPVETQEGENTNAIQEQSARTVDVQPTPTDGEGVGSENEPVEVAGESQPIAPSSSEVPQPTALKKAIDAVTHGIVVPENIMGRDPSARFDFGMTTAEKQKAVRDIKAGNYETVPAKKMLSKLQEWDANDAYPIIEGLGGESVRRKAATAEEIQQNIDDAKAHKIGELSPRQVEEINKPLKELGFTHQDFIDYENHRAETERGDSGTTESDSNYVQQPKNDIPTSASQDTGSEATQRESTEPVSSKKESTQEQADKVGVTLDDNKGGVRTREIVESEADKALKDGYDIHELVKKIKDDKHVATDTENAILAKHIATRTDEIVDLNKQIEDGAATMSAEKLDELTARRDAALNDFQEVANANDQTRSDAGRALQSGKFRLNNNYSLEALIKNERRLNDGKPLSAEQLADVSKRHAELEKSNAEYEKKLQESQEEIARLKAERAVRKPGVIRSKAKTHEDFVKERKAIAQQFSNKLAELRKNGQLNDVFTASTDFLRAAAPYVAGMVRSLAHEGITELGEVVKRIREELDLKDLSTKDMYDLVSGKHNKPVTKSDLQARVNRLKTEAKLLSQIDDAEKNARNLPESKRKSSDEKIDGLRKRLKELDKENGLYDERNEQATRDRLTKEIKDLQDRLANGDFEKPEKAIPDETPEVRGLRRKRDAARHEYDLEQARRELDKRGKLEKAKDFALNVATLPRAIKATLDFSAVLRQGLIPTVSHPTQALKALKTMFGQTFSEKKYQDWFSDIKQSPQYDLMKASGLYISEKNNPELLAREEQFTSNLLEKVPVLGKIHQGAERAYTGYLNAIRTGVFIEEAAKLQERGYTFKNNPEMFRDLATVINTLSGRGSIPDWLGGKQPAVLSNIFFSPRFMAARIHTLYLWGDPRLSRSAKVLAAKDIGKTLATAATILGMAKLSGAQVSTDPRGSDFLKLKDGDTRYDLLGGLSQYVVFLSQMLTGQKVPAGTNKVNSLTSGKYGKPTRFDAGVNFLRGKLSPLIGAGTNLMAGKDIVGQKYDISNVPQEFVPLPASDLYDAYKVGGWENSLKVLVPSQFGVGVSSFKNKKK